MAMLDDTYRELAKPFGATERWRIKEIITFSKEDGAGIQFLHIDATTVTLNINNLNVHCVLVDSRSAIDILYFLAFSRMNLSVEYLERYESLIQDFNGDLVPLEGMIILLVKSSTYP